MVAALQGVVRSVEAVCADLAGAAASAADAAAATAASAAALPASKWAALLAHAQGELGGVLGLLPLQAEWKAQLSGAYVRLLEAMLAARRWEHSPMLAGLRVALASGRQPLPLTGADAAQVGAAGGGLGGPWAAPRPEQPQVDADATRLPRHPPARPPTHPPTHRPSHPACSCSCASRSSRAC